MRWLCQELLKLKHSAYTQVFPLNWPTRGMCPIIELGEISRSITPDPHHRSTLAPHSRNKRSISLTDSIHGSGDRLRLFWLKSMPYPTETTQYCCFVSSDFAGDAPMCPHSTGAVYSIYAEIYFCQATNVAITHERCLKNSKRFTRDIIFNRSQRSCAAMLPSLCAR